MLMGRTACSVAKKGLGSLLRANGADFPPMKKKCCGDIQKGYNLRINGGADCAAGASNFL